VTSIRHDGESAKQLKERAAFYAKAEILSRTQPNPYVKQNSWSTQYHAAGIREPGHVSI